MTANNARLQKYILPISSKFGDQIFSIFHNIHRMVCFIIMWSSENHLLCLVWSQLPSFIWEFFNIYIYVYTHIMQILLPPNYPLRKPLFGYSIMSSIKFVSDPSDTDHSIQLAQEIHSAKLLLITINIIYFFIFTRSLI